MNTLIKVIAVAVTLAAPAVLADGAIAAANLAGVHRNLADAVPGVNQLRQDVRHRVRRHSGHRYRWLRYRGRGFRSHGAWRGCHRVRRIRISRHGRRIRTGGIMCYDHWGRPYIVAGSHHVIR